MTEHNLNKLAEEILSYAPDEEILRTDENDMWDLCSMERLQAMVREWQERLYSPSNRYTLAVWDNDLNDWWHISGPSYASALAHAEQSGYRKWRIVTFESLAEDHPFRSLSHPYHTDYDGNNTYRVPVTPVTTDGEDNDQN